MFKQLIANINTLARAIGLEMKKLAQKDGEIEEKIRRLSVGGRNLVLHTSQPKLVKAPERFVLFLFNQPLIRGNTYTFTAKVSNVKGNTGGKITIAISKNEGTSNRSVQVIEVPIVNGTLRHTFTASSDGMNGVNIYANSGGWAGAATGEHIVSEVMIEDGAYPSSWRPAIEDSSNGRNLLFDSEFKTANKWGTFDGYQISQTRHKGRVYTRIDITKDIPASNTPSIGVQNATGTSIIGGKTYTLSLNIQGTPGIAAKGLGYCYLMYNDDQPNFKIPHLTIDHSISSRSSVTFVAPRSSDKCSILIGFSDVVSKGNWIGFHSVKLEEGSIATEWLPSIEDQDVHFNRLEKMTIGGRNYILNSKDERQATASGTSETFITYSLSEKLEPNTTYTLSGWVKATPNARDIQIYFISGNLNNNNTYANKFGDWTFVRRTFTTTATTTPENYVRVDNNGSIDSHPSTVWAKSFKLEKGNEITDWSPAPEDLSGVIVGGYNYYNPTGIHKFLHQPLEFSLRPEDGIQIRKATTGFSIFRLDRTISSVEPWTVSFEAKSLGTPTIMSADICDQGKTSFPLTSEWKRCVVTATPLRIDNLFHFVDFELNTVSNVEIRRLKIERGTVATEWYPREGIKTIGGRNFLEDTENFSNDVWFLHTHQDEVGKGVVYAEDGNLVMQGTLSGRWKEIVISTPSPRNGLIHKTSEALDLLEMGKLYVLSFEAKSDVPNQWIQTFWREYNYNGETPPKIVGGSNRDTVRHDLTTEWKKYHAVFRFGRFALDGQVRRNLALFFQYFGDKQVRIRRPQLEEGTIPSTWRPALEDAKLSLRVGGSNLLPNTETLGQTWGVYSNANGASGLVADGTIKITNPTKTWAHMRSSLIEGSELENFLAEGREFTLSVYARKLTDEPVRLQASLRCGLSRGFEGLHISTTQPLTKEWKRYVATGRVPEGKDWTYVAALFEILDVATIELKKPQLERGNVVTDWKPQQLPGSGQAISTSTTYNLWDLNSGAFFREPGITEVTVDRTNSHVAVLGQAGLYKGFFSLVWENLLVGNQPVRPDTVYTISFEVFIPDSSKPLVTIGKVSVAFDNTSTIDLNSVLRSNVTPDGWTRFTASLRTGDRIHKNTFILEMGKMDGSSGVVPELHIRKLQLQEGLEATPYQKNLNVLQTLETGIQTLRTEALRLSDIGRLERVNRCLPFKQSSNGGGLLQVFIENHLTNEVGFFRSGSSQGTNRDILISTKVRNPAPGILPDIATSSGNNQVLVISFWVKLGAHFPNINDVKLSCIGNEVPIRLQNNTEWQRVVATLDMTKVTPKTTSIASLDIHIKVKDHASGQLTWRLFIKEMQAFLYLQKRGDGVYPIPAGYVHFGVIRNLYKDLYVE